jgi:hypothetical protein
MFLENYLEQHESIKSELRILKDLADKENLDTYGDKLALHVNTLAGKIRIHLVSEDKYLYPDLIEKGDPRLKKMATDYKNEMGDLADKFIVFKDRYNTKNKILKGESSIRADLKNIADQIEKRIRREENELYQSLN